MKIVVIGKKGQLATALQQLRPVTAFSKEEIDLANPTPLADYSFDVLINAGAYNATERAELEPDLAFALNAHGVGKLAEIAQAKQALLIHISSDFVFSGKKQAPYNEEDTLEPLNVYGASKALGEKLAMGASRHYIFRTASLYSQGPNNFPSSILRKAREGKELKVVDDIFMNPTNVHCLAEWIYRAIDLNIPYGIYHAANKGEASWFQLALKVLEKAQLNVPLIPCSHREYPSAIKRPLRSVLSVAKLEQAIGPLLHWEEALYV